MTYPTGFKMPPQQYITSKLRHFSASQVNTISSCPFKWACRYVFDIPKEEKPEGQNLQLGKALHKCAQDNSLVEGEVTKEAVLNGLKDVMESNGFDKSNHSALADLYLEKYCKDKDFNTSSTEFKIYGAVPGVSLPCLGYVDYMDDDTIYDLKIKSVLNKVEGEVVPTLSEFVQQGLYAHFNRKPDGTFKSTKLCIFHIKKGTKTRDPVFTYIEAPKMYSAIDMERVFQLTRLAVYHMYSGVYPPNRNYMWCKFNMCDYWDYCHTVWG
jgi:hypothetical protein